MFKNNCSGCGKYVSTYALNRRGDLPIVFCNGVCETAYRKEKSMANMKTIVTHKKGLTTEEITKRIAQKHWNNREHIVEEIAI